jgi:4-deoxy-L-threo-5-hexosulose-uronate ketol-isomerase
MEAYVYCARAPESRVVLLMGVPTETRHWVVTHELGAFGPPWAIHTGAGIRGYRFIRAMASGNIDFTNMNIWLAETLL